MEDFQKKIQVLIRESAKYKVGDTVYAARDYYDVEDFTYRKLVVRKLAISYTKDGEYYISYHCENKNTLVCRSEDEMFPTLEALQKSRFETFMRAAKMWMSDEIEGDTCDDEE